MGKPVSLLEGLSGHALSFGANAIEVEYKDDCGWVYARKGETTFRIARYRRSGRDERELRENLQAAAKRKILTVLNGQRCILKVRIFEKSGEDAFEVAIDPAPPLDPTAPPSFTAKQGRYLAYIYHYSKIHRQAPSEADLQRYFNVSPPSVHEMIKTLERNGFIQRTAGAPRSIRVLVAHEHLPPLE